jgi:hypothetical protein
MSKCSHCFDEHLGYNTGEVGQRGFLDCVYCTAAEERLTLNEAIRKIGPIVRQDEYWYAYQLGKEAARKEVLAESQ